MRYLGIDYGTKRVGIAISDENGEFALPYTVWPNDKNLISKIASLCKERGISEIVIGESRDFSGVENPVQKAINAFSEKLKSEINLPIHFEPEFLTSREAKHIQGQNDMLDASAAALILRSFLDKQKNR